MDGLMHNQTFRILKELIPTTTYLPGIYRVILNCGGEVAAALIKPDEPPDRNAKGGRKRKGQEEGKKVKATPVPLVGKVHWLETQQLARLHQAMLLKPLEVERLGVDYSESLSTASKAIYALRRRFMADFLDQVQLSEELLPGGNLSRMFKRVASVHGVHRSNIEKQWSNLCRYGFDERSLLPRLPRCGGKGKTRRCDPGGRRKAGRKTTKERIALAYGEAPSPTQPGMSTEWAARIMAADAQIPTPKPKWETRWTSILSSAFCGKAVQLPDGEIEYVQPPLGEVPNEGQIRRVLHTGYDSLSRARLRTTARHFERNQRGFKGRNWQDVAGPGHTWAIDSTLGDIYLRSSINLAWIIGRPVVYIVVDIWSTAVVGFYVCLTGPSWETAAVSLFNSACDPALLGKLWGYVPMMTLDPLPGMCYALMSDRGEILSRAHRAGTKNLIQLTQYAPPYAGDLKGLVEVLHRIEKDHQHLFVPGAIDYRRKELELRRVNPASSTMTLKQYVKYLELTFAQYNFTADRTNRRDVHMIPAGVEMTPAGLWTYGHTVGIGFGRKTSQSDLIMDLLPSSTGFVGRRSVRFEKGDYSSPDVEDKQWTALARNFAGWEIPVRYYPGSVSQIWTPNRDAEGLLPLTLCDQSHATPEATYDEVYDSIAYHLTGKAKREHDRCMKKVYFYNLRKELRDMAALATAEADAAYSGPLPTQTEARVMEVAASRSHKSEAKVVEELREEAISEHEQMMRRLFAGMKDTEKSDA